MSQWALTRRILAIGAAALLLFSLPLSARTLVYNGDRIEGWVVDAETNQPLEGVNIVVHWELKSWFMQANPIAQIHIDETVTDQKGHYLLNSWGPKFALLGYLRDGPELMFFKPGYKYFGTSNMPGSDTSKSDWNKKTVKLERFKGTMEEYARTLSSLSISLRFAYDNENCEMKFVPRMLIALYLEEKRFREAKVYNSLPSLNHELHDQKYQDKCGIRSVLRSYLP